MRIGCLIFTLLATCLIFTSCTKEPPDFEESVVSVADDSNVIDTQLSEEEKEAIKLQLQKDISNMSPEERANDFIKALNSGDIDRLEGYIESLSIQEFSKAKFDAEIIRVKEKCDVPDIEYQFDVRLTVSESESVAFEKGTFDYSLLMRDFPDPGFVVYFGPSERTALIRKNNAPTKDTPDVYSAYYSVLPLFDFISSEPTQEKISKAERSAIAHATVHTIHALYGGEIFLTKDEFKDIVRDIYNLEDDEIADWLDFKYPSKNGVYSIYCAHDGIVTYDIYEGLEKTEKGFKLTFSLYSDSAYIVKCGTLVVAFEENENSDLMRIADIDLEKQLDYPAYTFAP